MAKQISLLPVPHNVDDRVLSYLDTNFRRIVDAVAQKILLGDLDPTVYGAAGYPIDVAAAEADGVLSTLARADHKHAHGSGYLGGAHPHDHSPESIQVGSVNISVVASITGSVAVVFGTAFAVAPKVIASVGTTAVPSGVAAYNISVFDVATTGFTAFARHIDGTSTTITVPIMWVAALV